MTNRCLGAFSLLLVALPLFAQDETPAVEVSIDYSYLNQELDPIAVQLPEQAASQQSRRLFGRESESIPGGMGLSVVANASRSVGFVADLSFHRRTTTDLKTFAIALPLASSDDVPDFVSTRVRRTYFLFGPRFTKRSRYVSGFVQGLFGGLRMTDELAAGILAEPFSTEDPTLELLSRKKTAFSMGLGGGFDINVGSGVAIRPFQVDYLPYRLNGRWRHNFRYKAGVVLRMGEL